MNMPDWESVHFPNKVISNQFELRKGPGVEDDVAGGSEM